MDRELSTKINVALASRGGAHRAEMKKVFDRAEKLGEKGQALALRMFTEGKSHDEITDALFAEAAKDRKIEAAGKRFEQISDDDFVRALQEPVVMVLDSGGKESSGHVSSRRAMDHISDNALVVGLSNPVITLD